MPNLRWIASSSVSALAVASAVSEGHRPLDPRLADAIARPAADLRAALVESSVPTSSFFEHAIPLAAGIESNRELAALSLTKTVGARQAESAASRVTAALADLESAFRGVMPDVVAELETRSLPLREQWEARGTGLLAQIGRLTDRDLIVESADVLLVPPIHGGGGESHLPYNAVTFEAVLANVHAGLHEIVRLGWLVSLLHLDVPRFSENIPQSRRPILLRLAMTPPALAAAEHVELIASAEESLPLALDTWGLSNRTPPGATEIIRDWWLTYQTSPVAWNVALVALDQMLQPPATA